MLQVPESTDTRLTLYKPIVLNVCDTAGEVVVTVGLPSLKSQIYFLPCATVSIKSTAMGTQPEVSRGTPFTLACMPAPTPARLNAILIAARLQSLELFVCDHTPGVVGKASAPVGFCAPQLAQM